MKIFVPMSDKLLSNDAEMRGMLVPFTPELLQSNGDQAPAETPPKRRRLVNWIQESNYAEACSRLQLA